MTSSADVTRFLLEKGVALDVALAAAEVAEKAVIDALSTRHPLDSRGDKQRAWDREYRKRKRARPLDIHSTPLDIHSTPAVQQPVATSENLSSFSKDSKILTKNPLEDREALTAARPQTKRGCRLPEDWTPSDPDYAVEILRDRAAIELEKFRNHWAAEAGAKAVKRDWDAAWRNWVIKASEFAPRSQAARPLTYAQQAREETNAIRARLRAEADRIEGGGDTAQLFPADHSQQPRGLYRGNGPTVLELSRLRDRGSD